MATFAFGACCCSVLYAEGFAVKATGAGLDEILVYRFGWSQHSDYDQDAIDAAWSVTITEAIDSSAGSEHVVDTTTSPRDNLNVLTRVSTSGDTLWVISAVETGHAFFAAIDISDPSSPSLTGCYFVENGGGGTEYMIQNASIYQIVMDGGPASRSEYGEDWFIYIDHEAGTFPNPQPRSMIRWADPANYVYREDAYYDTETGTDWIPLTISRNEFPPRMAACKITQTKTGSIIDEVEVEIAYADLPSSKPTSYPESHSPTFTTFFSRTFTNNGTAYRASTGEKCLALACSLLLVEFDWDSDGDTPVYCVLAPDTATLTDADFYYDDVDWAYHWSHSVGSATSVSHDPGGFVIPEVNMGFNPTVSPYHRNVDAPVEMRPDGNGDVYARMWDGDAYKGDTLLASGFGNSLDAADTDAYGGTHNGQGGTTAYGAHASPQIGVLLRYYNHGKFVDVSEEAEGSRTKQRLYLCHGTTSARYSAAADDYSSEWGVGAISVYDGDGYYRSMQIRWEDVASADFYSMPAYELDASPAEIWAQNPLDNDERAMTDVAFATNDPFIPPHDHVETNG